MNLIDSIAQAIATMEGFFRPGTIAQRQNNPGNLRTWGTRPVVNGYAVFESPEAGWAALRRQVELNINRGLSLQEFFGGKPGVYGGYAPAADSNDPHHYANFVAGRVGVDSTTPLNQMNPDSSTFDAASILDEINPFDGYGSSEEGSIDWGLLAALAVGAVAIWMVLSD